MLMRPCSSAQCQNRKRPSVSGTGTRRLLRASHACTGRMELQGPPTGSNGEVIVGGTHARAHVGSMHLTLWAARCSTHVVEPQTCRIQRQ